MHNYCSIASMEYIHKILLLYDSLLEHDNNFRFFIICMSKETKALLNDLKLEKAVLLTIDQIERTDTQLAAVKSQRNEKEYAWTSKASVFLYLFRNYSDVEHLLWLDGDIVFYSSPEPIFQELKQCSLLLTRERFKGENKKLDNVYGIYNTGLMGLKRDKEAMGFIKWYRRKCLEWCYDQVTPSRFGDQKYLEVIGKRNTGIYISKSKTTNAAMWNMENSKVETSEGQVYIDGEKLMFFHFSSFFILSENEFDLWMWEQPKLDEKIKEAVYFPYVKAIKGAIELMKTKEKDISQFISKYYDREAAGNHLIM